MPTAKQQMEAKYAEAAERFARVLHAVERSSQARLNKLLQLLPSERIAHFADPLLTRADALRLTRSLRTDLSSRRHYRAPLAARVNAIFKRIQIGRLFSSTTLLFLTMASIYSFIAWHNTAHLAAIARPIDIPFVYPDGSTRKLRMGTDKPWQLLRIRGNHAALRLWFPGQGYQEIEVPSEIIIRP
ncbi:hypothetical protein [Rhodopseudomonas pseudopalustris]|nr:hypothetical protein [Rhodopseudomonas pseudopalustris]